MSRRAGLVLLAFGAGLALLALRRAVAYDFERYAVISGFEASRWTWLLVMGGGAFALLGLFARSNVLRSAAVTNAIASACVAITIVWTVRTTSHRVEPARDVIDCSNQNIGVGCRLHQALDGLEPALPDAAPSHALLGATLGAYALMSMAFLMRNRARSRT
jgi:hypothetical protein